MDRYPIGRGIQFIDSTVRTLGMSFGHLFLHSKISPNKDGFEEGLKGQEQADLDYALCMARSAHMSISASG